MRMVLWSIAVLAVGAGAAGCNGSPTSPSRQVVATESRESAVLTGEITMRGSRDVAKVLLVMKVMEGKVECGTAYAPGALAAGVPSSFSASLLIFSYERCEPFSPEPVYVQPCQFPARTNRLVVEVYDQARTGGSAAPILAREFAESYTFVRP